MQQTTSADGILVAGERANTIYSVTRPLYKILKVCSKILLEMHYRHKYISHCILRKGPLNTGRFSNLFSSKGLYFFLAPRLESRAQVSTLNIYMLSQLCCRRQFIFSIFNENPMAVLTNNVFPVTVSPHPIHTNIVVSRDD